MSWVAVGVAGASLAGSALSADSAKSAASGQTQAANNAMMEQQRQHQISQQQQAPYLNAGSAGIGKLRELLGIAPTPQTWKPGDPTPAGALGLDQWAAQAGYNLPQHRGWFQHELDNLTPGYQQYLASQAPQGGAAQAGPSVESIMAMDPGYQFRLQEGNKALENAAKARGLFKSGGSVKEMMRYGQDYASGEFGNIVNRLAGITGTGQQAANTSAGLGANYAGNVGNLMTGAANARGAAGIAGANAWGQGFNTIGNWFGQQSMLDKILNKPSGGGGVAPTQQYGGMIPQQDYGYGI